MNKEKVLGVVRHILTAFSGWAIAKGVATDAAGWEAIVGAVILLAGTGWSWFAPEKTTPAE